MTKISKNLSKVHYSNSGTPFDITSITTPRIDSFKIRIPREQVIIKNDYLLDDYALVSKTTGEVIEDESNFKKSSYFYENKGVKTYYKAERQISKNEVKDYVTILLTSKSLFDRYFEGICSNTVIPFYDSIISQDVVSFSHDNFLYGQCTDMDIKMDLVPNAPVIDIVNGLYECATPKKLAHQAASIYRQKTNLGIQFSLRKTQAFKKYPYLKFYEKVRELKSHSLDFYSSFLLDHSLPSEILRIETTIKNKKHFKQLGQDSTQLISILDNLDTVGKEAFKRSFDAHLSDKMFDFIRVDNDVKKLGSKQLLPLEKVLLGYIEQKMISGQSFTMARKNIIDSCCVSKQQRYRMKKTINKIENYIDFTGLISGDETSKFEAWYSQVYEKIFYN